MEMIHGPLPFLIGRAEIESCSHCLASPCSDRLLAIFQFGAHSVPSGDTPLKIVGIRALYRTPYPTRRQGE